MMETTVINNIYVIFFLSSSISNDLDSLSSFSIVLNFLVHLIINKVYVTMLADKEVNPVVC